MNTIKRHLRPWIVAGLVLLGPALSQSHALLISVDTSVLAGQSGLLAFDLIGGDSVFANNTAFLLDFDTDGVLESTDPFTITDLGFFNEVLRGVTFGSYLNFSVELTENVAAPGFDQFSFFLLDAGIGLPLFSTTDPLGADALFAVDITGEPGGAVSSFQGIDTGVTWRVADSSVHVPDATSTLWLGLLSLGALGLLRSRVLVHA